MPRMTDPISSTIRDDYDRVASEYARRIADELARKPFDRQLLDRFAAQVAGRGPVCDMGCGPGHIARYLRDAGADAFGLDLSEGMLIEARRLNPSMHFVHGDMTALPLESNALSGITAFYSIVNIPLDVLPIIFNEMHRVLQPEGQLLLAFHVGNEQVEVGELWGQKIEMGFYLREPSAIQQLLEQSGFGIQEVLTREPYSPEVEHQTHRCYILARKPNKL